MTAAMRLFCTNDKQAGAKIIPISAPAFLATQPDFRIPYLEKGLRAMRSGEEVVECM